MSSLVENLLRKILNKSITIYVDNGLDQSVTIQIKGNRVQSLTKSVNVGSPFSVPAGSQDARVLTPDTSGFFPYITVSLVCSTAPTTGSVTIYRIRPDNTEAIIVNALAIRDTNSHDASKDPSNIFVIEW
jgi:hypothetical protein